MDYTRLLNFKIYSVYFCVQYYTSLIYVYIQIFIFNIYEGITETHYFSEIS